MKKAIIITGPTGVGKSALALKIAKSTKAALVSVDSIHIYRGCDIISGKDIPQDSKFIENTPSSKYSTINYWNINGTPLYLTDIVPPSYEFNVADFLRATSDVLKEVEDKDLHPIFVGGTTLYIKSLLSPIETAMIPKDPNLRFKLENAAVPELQAILAKKNKSKLSTMNESDINNPRRLIRAIEIAGAQIPKVKSPLEQYTVLPVGIKSEREALKARIEKRIMKRVKSGAIEEAKTLFQTYSSLSTNIKSANGYKEMFEYLQNSISKDQAIEKWKFSEFQHAKNQMTYLLKLPQIKWFDIEEKGYSDKVISTVNKFLQD